MAKRTVNYKGIRWLFFANLAGRFNPDIADALENKTWTRRDKSWTDLQKAVQQPYLDPIVRAISDMTGEDFGVVRQAALEGMRSRVISQPRGEQPSMAMAVKSATIFAVEPFAFLWTNIRFLRRTLDMVSMDPKDRPFWLKEQGDAYAEKLYRYQYALGEAERGFSTSPKSAQKMLSEIASISVREVSGMSERMRVTSLYALYVSMACFSAPYSYAMRDPSRLLPDTGGSEVGGIVLFDQIRDATRYCVSAAVDLIDDQYPQWIMKSIEAAADDLLQYPPTPVTDGSGALPSSPAIYAAAGVAAGAIAVRLLSRS